MNLEAILISSFALAVLVGIIAAFLFFDRHVPDPHCKRCKGEGFIEIPELTRGVGVIHTEVCTCWHSVKERKKSEQTLTHWKCLRTKVCQETDGFRGTKHEGLYMCKDGCVWYQAFSKKIKVKTTKP